MIARLIVLITLMVLACQTYAQVENEEVVRHVEETYGPIISREKAPVLYKTLSNIFNDLAKAQEALSEGAVVSINQFHIVQSSVINAFVNSEVKQGIRVIRNNVFVTTGLIESMMQGDDSSKGLLKLAGILAHELGHPMDSVFQHRGSISIQDHYGSAGDQAVEIRADIDAMRILRQANYPVNSLYLALSTLFETDKKVAAAVSAGSSTHPEKYFRLTSARMFLTYDRLKNSTLQNPKKLDAEIRNVKAELEGLQSSEVRNPFVPPLNFIDAVKRLELVGENNVKDPHLEYNRLVLSIDNFLLDKQNKNIELTPLEIETFKLYLSILRKSSGFGFNSIQEKTSIRENINAKTGSPGLANSLSHETFLLRLKIFSSNIVKDFLLEEKKILLTKEKTYGDDFKLYAMMNIAHPDIYKDVFGDYIIANLVNNEAIDALQTAVRPFGLSHYEMILDLLTRGSTEYESNLQNYGSLKRAKYRNTYGMLFPFITKESGKGSTGFRPAYRQALILAQSTSNPEYKIQMQKSVDEVKAFFQNFWQKRAFYAVIESQLSTVIDWDLVFEVLKIRPDLGLQQIQTDVLNYRDGRLKLEGLPTYAQLVSHFKSTPKSDLSSGKKKWLVWDTKNILAAKNEQESKSNGLFQETYDVKDKVSFKKTFLQKVSVQISNVTSVQDLITLHSQLVPKNENNGEVLAYEGQIYFKLYLSAILKSALSPEVKSKLVHFLLFDETTSKLSLSAFKDQFYGDLNAKASYLNSLSGLEVALESYKSITQGDSVDFFLKLRSRWKELDFSDKDYFLALDSVGEKILSDLKNKSIDSFEAMIDRSEFLMPIIRERINYKESITNPQSPKYSVTKTSADSSQKNSVKIQKMKSFFLSKSKDFKLSEGQIYKLYLALTGTGPTTETDQLFFKLFNLQTKDISLQGLEKMSKTIPEKTLRRIEALLGQGRIRSERLRLQLAVLVMEPTLVTLQKSLPVDREAIHQVISNKLNIYAEQGSLEKDKYIERIAWRFKLVRSELDGFVEDQKSQNWKKANPLIIRAGSMLSSEISKMNTENKMNFIKYLLDPMNTKTNIFEKIMDDLRKTAYSDLLSGLSGTITVEKERTLRLQADRSAEAFRLKAEEAIRDSSPTERIPLFEVVLTSGSNPIFQSKNWHLEIGRKFLGYKEDSIEEALLDSFLEVIPEHEKSVAISYLLANSSDGKGSMANLFEVFGTVGIKFGQLASIWEIFGKKIADESKHLKSSASPMSRYDIIKLVESREPSLQGKIVDYEVILGSASVKTVVKVTLTDGRKVALLLQAENIHDNIAMNLNLGKKFIETLKKRNVVNNSLFLQSMIEALEEQLADEIDMQAEAKNFKKANEIADQLNKELSADLSGWKFKVPQPIEGMPLRKDMAFYDLVEGIPFDSVRKDQQAKLGHLIAKANLRSLFKFGWFDPDRHSGNILINEKTKEIIFLDYGQFASFSKSKNPFKWDPRLTLSSFVAALDKRDAVEILHYAKLMTNGKKPLSSKEESQLLTQMNRILAKEAADSDFKNSTLAVIDLLMNSGIKIESKFLFGALKGLIILYGEKYTTTDEFKKLMRSEIVDLVVKKAPAVAISKGQILSDKILNENYKSATRSVRCEALFSH